MGRVPPPPPVPWGTVCCSAHSISTQKISAPAFSGRLQTAERRSPGRQWLWASPRSGTGAESSSDTAGPSPTPASPHFPQSSSSQSSNLAVPFGCSFALGATGGFPAADDDPLLAGGGASSASSPQPVQETSLGGGFLFAGPAVRAATRQAAGQRCRAACRTGRRRTQGRQ